MPRQNQTVENLLLLGKIRKRGCSSPTSSTSSVLREGYRFKRAIVVGKRGGSTTPVPTWRLMGRSPSPAASPGYAPSQCGSKTGRGGAPAAPVSARKLAATLWEMNEMPSSPRGVEEVRKVRKERIAPLPPPPPRSRSVRSGSLPPHLSDPSHSPVSERMERSGTGSRQRRASSTVQKLRLGDHNVVARDRISNASFMDIETRSRAETPTGSTTVGVKTRLKDCSNALTTSKELLKIINRMWGQEDRPSSSMSLVSALHSELERARLQVNEVIREHRPENNDVTYLMKRFAEEKAAWKSHEQEVVEAAIESVAGELEVERKLRRRFEGLNKKLGKELSDTKAALMKAVKEIENEKRARVMVEKVCDELARDISEDKAEVEELKRESFKVKEEVEKEREMLQLADALRESSSTAASSDSKCCQVKETEKQSKKGWLTRLLSMGCSADTKVESGGGIRASSTGYGDVLSRVKVKHCKKQAKELSALYQCQDIKGHNGSILAMKFSGDGKYLASAGEDGVVRVWKVIEDKRSRLLRKDCLNEINPSCIYFEVNDLSQLKPVLLDEDKKPNKTTESFKKTSDSACIVFPPKVFRLVEKPLHEFRGHAGEVLDISWSKDNSLLSASMDKTVRLWKLGSNVCRGVFPHNGYVTSVQFNPVNENYFMSGSIDGKVRIWNISGCNVVDWADLKDIISAVCYRPDGQGGIIGSLTGSCRFFSMCGDYLELDSQIHLHHKKKSSNKRITGFQFLPQDQSKVLVVSADSKVRILQGNDVVRKYKGVCKTRSLTSASLTSDGKHIVSACEDSNVYIWSNGEELDSSSSSQTKKIKSFERFSTNASVAATWSGFSDYNTSLPFASPPCLSLNEGYVPGSVPKGSATWPEENLPANNPLSSMTASHYKFLKSSYQRSTSSLAWGMVIVTGGWDGRIKTFQNYGLPVTVT